MGIVNDLSRMASATVASAIRSCHLATGTSGGDQGGFASIAAISQQRQACLMLSALTRSPSAQ